MKLTQDNFSQGFLVDEELMGGVTQSPEDPGIFVAYVLNHMTGEYLGYRPFPELNQALEAISQVQRPWVFEATSGCGSGKCSGGKCKGEKCAINTVRKAKKLETDCADGSCATPQGESVVTE